MSEQNEYRSVAGVVTFDPQEREVAGKTIQSVTIRPMALGNAPLVNLTVWPENRITVKRGDFILANGKYTTREGQTSDGDPRTYHDISVYSVVVLPAGEAVAASKPAAKGKKKPVDDPGF